MSNYLISLHHPKFGLTLFKDGFTGNHRLDADGKPSARMREFVREYGKHGWQVDYHSCLLYTSPSPRDYAASRMPSSA